MPPGLAAVLAALAAEAGPDEFAAVEGLLGGSLSVLAGSVGTLPPGSTRPA